MALALLLYHLFLAHRDLKVSVCVHLKKAGVQLQDVQNVVWEEINNPVVVIKALVIFRSFSVVPDVV